ncbi:MAG: hypothetical protein J0H65_09055 [Rhizobiales bacterium]|nr:hypothetical protein [Hyphomicrobiales bacterium]
MAKTKETADDGKGQRQKFIDAARELGADGDEDTFRKAVRKIATAPPTKAKKAAQKPKP